MQVISFQQQGVDWNLANNPPGEVASHLLNMHSEGKSPGQEANSVSLVVKSCHTSKGPTTMIFTKDSKISIFQPDGIYIHQESKVSIKGLYHWLVQVKGADK